MPISSVGELEEVLSVYVQRAAVTALGPQLVPGKHYVRAGVTLSELVPRDQHATLDVFGTGPTLTPSTAVVDDIAAKFGEDTLGLGLAGLRTRRAWTMKRDMISPRATTHWDELVVVRAR